MSITTNIKLNESIVPSIPFIWYREQELTCTIDYLGVSSLTKVNELYNLEGDSIEDIYVVIQRNISGSDNLYICLHSLLYYELNKNNVVDNLLIIPSKFRINLPFEVNTIMLDNTKIVELNNGIKMNDKVVGNIHIHDAAFSPPGTLHFKMDPSDKYAVLLCNIKCDKCEKININLNVLFILFNNDSDNNIDNDINEIIEKLKI